MDPWRDSKHGRLLKPRQHRGRSCGEGSRKGEQAGAGDRGMEGFRARLQQAVLAVASEMDRRLSLAQIH